MLYFFEKNSQIYSTSSIDQLIYHSFPADIQSPEKIAHYKTVAPVIFSPQYKASLSVTTEDIHLGQDFIDFLAHHNLTSANKYHGVDLLYLLSLSHDTALRAGVWKLGSQTHLEATNVISRLAKLDAHDRAHQMKESIRVWKELFLKAQSELQLQETGNCPDSTRNMLVQLFSSKNDKTNDYGQSQSDQKRLEAEQEQFRLLERAYHQKEQDKINEMESYSHEDEDYYIPQPQYYYN
ncbi:Uncharacterised protein [Legionella wadsworthii]|uniref:Uncharacterized protein n=1 Tax=Legionella wadsworthii TaxID=28088 RepID=A0A378LP11_9GAMM|nr:hypothetical protein [Legionella wadsworthii]STY28493.1 Uncharacterised protein [Legionella wadsworthii]